MIGDTRENVIEWICGDRMIACTFTQQKYVNRILRMSKKHPEIEIIKHNNDGSLYARIPIKALHISIYIRGLEKQSGAKVLAK